MRTKTRINRKDKFEAQSLVLNYFNWKGEHMIFRLSSGKYAKIKASELLKTIKIYGKAN